MNRIRNAILGLSTVLALGACGAGKPEGHWAEGVVESVDAPAKQVTIDHGEIPDLMGR
jgi:Cu/Ag efflux protein CusF